MRRPHYLIFCLFVLMACSSDNPTTIISATETEQGSGGDDGTATDDETLPDGIILPEFGKLYSVDYRFGYDNGVHLKEINLANGQLSDTIRTLYSLPDGFGRFRYSNTSKTLFYKTDLECGSAGGCKSHGVTYNIEADNSFWFTMALDWDSDTRFQFLGMGDGYAFRTTWHGTPTETIDFKLRKFSLETFETDLLLSFSFPTAEEQELISTVRSIGSGIYRAETNSLVKFQSGFGLITLNLDTFEKHTFENFIFIKDLFELSDGRFLAIQDETKIIEINPNDGQIIQVLYESYENILSFAYSEETQSFFWLREDGDTVYYYNLITQAEETLPLSEPVDYIFFVE